MSGEFQRLQMSYVIVLQPQQITDQMHIVPAAEAVFAVEEEELSCSCDCSMVDGDGLVSTDPDRAALHAWYSFKSKL
jgi:hypothetical protein